MRRRGWKKFQKWRTKRKREKEKDFIHFFISFSFPLLLFTLILLIDIARACLSPCSRLNASSSQNSTKSSFIVFFENDARLLVFPPRGTENRGRQRVSTLVSNIAFGFIRTRSARKRHFLCVTPLSGQAFCLKEFHPSFQNLVIVIGSSKPGCHGSFSLSDKLIPFLNLKYSPPYSQFCFIDNYLGANIWSLRILATQWI